MTSKKRSQAKSTVTLSFHFTVLPVENGYRLHVSYGEQEYMWPDLYRTLEQAGKQILQALTTASESRGETSKNTPPSAIFGRGHLRKALRDRQLALAELVHAIREHRKIADSMPLTLQGGDYARSVHELNKAIDRAEGLLVL